MTHGCCGQLCGAEWVLPPEAGPASAVSIPVFLAPLVLQELWGLNRLVDPLSDLCITFILSAVRAAPLIQCGFQKAKRTWRSHSFLANMLQHMQYTVDKCVYFLYCALLNHKRQEQQPTAATMPSKPVVTGKCRASKPPCPVLAVVGFCGCSFVWCASEEAWQRPHWAASSSYAYPRYSEDRKRRRTPDAAAPTAQPTHWCHTIRPPLEHLATSTRTSHTAHPLELQHRRLFADRALSKRTIKTRKH